MQLYVLDVASGRLQLKYSLGGVVDTSFKSNICNLHWFATNIGFSFVRPGLQYDV